jgi:DNA polymerase-1
MREIAADLETNGLLDEVTEIYCCAFVDEESEVLIVGHDAVLGYCRTLLADGVILVFHNAAYDVAVLRKFGVNIKQGQYRCTMVLWHKINPSMGGYGLDVMAKRVGMQKTDYEAALTAAGMYDPSVGESIWLTPYNTVMGDYCLQDTKVCWRLWSDGKRHLAADKRLSSSYYEVHLPFIEVMMSMSGGMFIDRAALVRLMTEMLAAQQERLNAFNEKYPKVAKLKWSKEIREYEVQDGQFHPPNIKSPNDVASLLYAHGWTPVERDFKTNRPKTSQATMRYSLATLEDGKLKDLIAELSDLKSVEGILTQLTTILGCVDIETGYLKGNWYQCGTVTHRLSSSSPNMQNLSARHRVWGKRVRSIFTAPPGYSLLIGDLSQIEICILAAYLEICNDDSTMAQGARDGSDFHNVNTAAWFDIDESSPEWKAKRPIAKNGIFASSYGAKAQRLAFTLGVSISEAVEILGVVDSRTSINTLKQKVWNTARTERNVYPVRHYGQNVTSGFLYDSLGTRCFYPNLNSKVRYERSSAERQSFNALMQTGCFSIFAHLLNLSLPLVQDAGGWVMATVHDEAHFAIPDDKAEEVLAAINEVFSSYVIPTSKGGVPVRASFSICKNWSEKT